jgi:hypothetical protein
MILPNATSLLNCSRFLKTSERLIFGYFFSIFAPKRTMPKLRFYLKEGKNGIYPFISETLPIHLFNLFISTFFCVLRFV